MGKINLHPDDRLSRFILSKNHVAVTKNLVKPGAFLPPNNKKLSVFHTEGLAEHSIWRLADTHVERKKHIDLRADITVRIIKKAKLIINADYEPNRHVNITGWPPEKDEQKAYALELARYAKLVKR